MQGLPSPAVVRLRVLLGQSASALNLCHIIRSVHVLASGSSASVRTLRELGVELCFQAWGQARPELVSSQKPLLPFQLAS